MESSCHTIFPVNPPIVKVRQWKNKGDARDIYFIGSEHNSEVKETIEKFLQKQHCDIAILKKTFGNMYENLQESKHIQVIYEALFKDDTIQTLLLKIVHYLSLEKEKLYPYIWSDKSPLRFRFLKNTWVNYDANPFQSNFKEIPVVPEVQQLSDHIIPFTQLELVTYSDLIQYTSKGQVLKYYFPNEKDTFRVTELQGVIYEQQLLKQLWYTPVKNHQAMIQQSNCSYSRAIFTGKLDTEVSYKQMFDEIHTTKTLTFLQFYDDMNHIYYKVYKKHKIPESLFAEWTNPEFFTNQHSITCYSFIKNSSVSYMKLFMDQQKEVHITYRLDISENIGYEVIRAHLDSVLEELEKMIHVKILPIVERLAFKTSISVRNVHLKSLSASFAKLPAIFHVPSKNRIQKNILDMQFKRVEKYGESKNIVELIKSKLELDVPLIDILLELQEYGIEEQEVREYVEQIQKAEDLPMEKRKKRNFKNLGLIMHVTPISLGLQIYIDNASSFTDMQNALFWIRCAVYQWQQSSLVLRPSPGQQSQPQEEIRPVSPESGPLIPSPREISDTGSELSFGSSSSGRLSLPSSMGGAIGKKHQRLFKNMLEKLDPDIFAKTDNYARKCGISDLRQPVGMTLEQKEKIDKQGYGDGYDNYIVYGSDPKKQNVYMCPKIYCPNSQIPLSYEKYVQNGEKCPDPEDEPILLYTTSSWYNDPTRAHYIGFLKEKGYQNLKLPCCFKKPQTEKESKSTKRKQTDEESKEIPRPESKKVVEEGYIIDKIRQLNEGRFGSIPTSLHDFLYEGVPYSLCKSTVKSKECVLRRGISQTEDSLMQAIAYLLNFETKEKLLIHIQEKLDPFTFLTLENGKVYTYFLPTKPILPEINVEKRRHLRIWLDKHKEYTRQFGLEELLPILANDSIQEVPKAIRYKIARQLMIHASYERYLAYLEDHEVKNPYLLFDMIHHIGALIIVWNRDSQNIATMRCPYSAKNKQWYHGQDNIPYIMVMQQESYYEPLVVVDQHKNITQKILFTHFEKLQHLLSTCPSMMVYEDKQIQDLYSLTQWIEQLLSFPSTFTIKSLLINPQDQAIGCFLKNNIYIEFSTPLSMFSLKNVAEICNIPTIMYWEDLQHTILDIECYVQDVRLLQIKLQKLGLGLRLGTIRSQTSSIIKSIYTIPKVVYSEPPKIPLILKDVMIRTGDLIRNDSEAWFLLKKELLKKLIDEYDTLVQPLLSRSKKTQLKQLFTVFEYLDEPSRTAVILEETPYEDKVKLKHIYQNLLLDKPYYHKDTLIYEGYLKKEWIFTQKAIQQSLIEKVKFPTTIDRPKNAPDVLKETILNVQVPDSLKYPVLLNKEKLTMVPVPSKWRTQIWHKYMIGMLPSYQKNTLLEVFEWVAAQRGIQFDKEDLFYYLRKQVYLLIEKPASYEVLLEDPAMRHAWNAVLGRKYRTVREIIDIGFAGKSVSELQELWKKASQSSEWTIQDLDLYNISKLLKVNFLLLQKGKDISTVRGNIQELVASSKFIYAHSKNTWVSMPLFIFYKQLSEDKKSFIYNILVSEKDISYYSQGRFAPIEIRKMIEKHLENV